MPLHTCPDCGHKMSERAVACPGCGAPGTGPPVIVAQPSMEEWALSRLTTGLPRRQIVDELVGHGTLARAEADALVKGVEAAALTPADEKSKWMFVGAGRSAALILILMLVAILLRLAAG